MPPFDADTLKDCDDLLCHGKEPACGEVCGDGADNEQCQNDCCLPVCAEGVVPCQTSADCPTDVPYFCITGRCIEVPM